MTADSALYISATALCVTAVAFILQAVALFRISRSAREMEAQVRDFAPRLQALIESTTKSVEESRRQISEASARVNEVLDLTRKQLASIDSLLGEASVRARIQMERMELVLDDAMGRMQDTIALLHEGILAPVRGIQGLVAGFRAGLGQFLRGRRPSVAQATHDEEMFI
jgi:ABC-type transporter Mla subunit MlaD